MILGWLAVPIPGEVVNATLPTPHIARYYETLTTQPPSTTREVVDGYGEVELDTNHKRFEVRLIKNTVFDIVLLDTLLR